VFRRFDLSGGPREWYEFSIDDNLSGVFGRMIPQDCDTDSCRSSHPLSGKRLVPDPNFEEFSGVTTGKCGGNPDVAAELLD
jgi:hypothetical protein